MPHELASPECAPPTLREQIQTAIRTELSIAREDLGFESFEDADDFEEEDPEADPLTIYEQVLMVPEVEESLDGSEASETAAEAGTPGEDTETPSPAPDDAPAAS